MAANGLMMTNTYSLEELLSATATDPTPSRAATFDAPGPGRWALDRSHHPGGVTPISKWLMENAMEAGLGRAFAELGNPAHSLRARFVNGFMYTRLRPLLGPDKPPKKLPPAFVLTVATRVHPAFRKRTRAAESSLRDKIWRDVIEQWNTTIRPRVVAQNDRFAAVELATIDDGTLADHVDALIAHCRSSFETHFWLHGFDLGPIAMYLHDVALLGITTADAVPALGGASPTTSAPIRELVRIRAMLDVAGVQPKSLAEVRGASPAIGAALDAYLAHHGDHLVTSYDLDGRTLMEMPDLVLSTICNAEGPAADSSAAYVATLRERVASKDRAEFDSLLTEARAVMDLRDDNGPNTVERPLGLLRYALLEVGRRLVKVGAADCTEHALEFGPTEVRPALLGSGSLGASDLRTRAQQRRADAALEPPLVLGPEEVMPPLSVLPPPLRRLVEMVQTALREMGLDGVPRIGPADGLSGIGVGTSTYRGRVRRAESPEAAIAALEPGDVLVVRATNPAFNAVLALAGAVVTAEGGPLSHAAVLARELGIAAVVGAPGAMTLPDGAIVDVDPVAGRVTIVTV
jgi:rifampicin phosphotransferase